MTEPKTAVGTGQNAERTRDSRAIPAFCTLPATYAGLSLLPSAVSAPLEFPLSREECPEYSRTLRRDPLERGRLRDVPRREARVQREALPKTPLNANARNRAILRVARERAQSSLDCHERIRIRVLPHLDLRALEEPRDLAAARELSVQIRRSDVHVRGAERPRRLALELVYENPKRHGRELLRD